MTQIPGGAVSSALQRRSPRPDGATGASPCTVCADPDLDCPCREYRQWLVAAYPAEVEPAGCSRCQEAEWLGLAGERFDQIAARLGLQARSLERHLERHGRTDLIRTDWKAHV